MGQNYVFVSGNKIEIKNNELIVANQGITDLNDIKGLENVDNLRTLNLVANLLTEIRGLGHLSSLQELRLANNQIMQLKGLDKLTNLIHLDISSNKIAEIEGLESLKKLRVVDLRNNQIGEIKGLDTLINLQVLDLGQNQLVEIGGLNTLKKLHTLTLNYNKISEIKGLENLTNLQELNLRSNQIQRLSKLEKLENLRVLDLSGNPLIDPIYATRNRSDKIAEIRYKKNSEGLPQIPSPYLGQEKSPQKSSRIFIVHGHDEAMLQMGARTLEKLKLEPIILHEKPSQGRTIIEKFEDYSDVGFAIVLLSPDDQVYLKENPNLIKLRARQNVILELGYFLGKLGRANVFILYKEVNDFEMPSDYQGVIYHLYDEKHPKDWQHELVDELQEQGYSVDKNKL